MKILNPTLCTLPQSLYCDTGRPLYVVWVIFMGIKTCSKCKASKDVSEFYTDKYETSGLRHKCKDCTKLESFNFSRTRHGLVARIIGDQKKAAKYHDYKKPEYTKDQLKEWLFSKSKFHDLYYNWVKSGYNKELVPSIDRINDYEGYNLNNIQLMTWKENRDKYFKDKITGVNNKNSMSVYQYDKDDNFIKKYYSQANASRETGVGQQNISKCINRERKKAGGYIWKNN